MILALLALAACGSPPPRAPVAGQVARAEVDAASAAYNDCVVAASKRLATPAMQASDAAAAAFKECLPNRTALVAKVLAFRRIGAPTEPLRNSRGVAEASVAVLESDMRAQAIVAAVSAQLDQDKTS